MVNGKEFRAGLRRPMPGAAKNPELRVVPAFTIQSMQKGTTVLPPPKCGTFKQAPSKPSTFRKFYKRGDLPISMETDTAGYKISWKIDIDKLDFHHYLPMFFDGLRDTEFPFKFFATQGILDMINYGGSKIFPVIPQIIIPIKKCLNTKNPAVMCQTLKILQHLVTNVDMAGVALVPYYRQLLPVLNIFKEKNGKYIEDDTPLDLKMEVNCGDNIDYTQQKRENVGDLINETLELLERYGGEDAFINIKYMIPTYESCTLN